MIEINNEIYNPEKFTKNDIFVCVFGYEQRSVYLFEKIKENLNENNILLFYFNDYWNKTQIDSLRNAGVVCKQAAYSEGKFVQTQICEFVRERAEKNKIITVHVDYSSMPRSWYYNLPILLREDNVKMSYWYVVGNYPMDYRAYPTAGIDTYTRIGKPSLLIDQKRVHIFGLSYDAVRTKALISELDPAMYITCNAYDSHNKEIGENVNELNSQICAMALAEVVLQIDDFSYMFSKLCELANEYAKIGSVIFVPDGPKPLIFAMSMVVLYLDKPGISCLHVCRNEKCFSQINVKPTDLVRGVSIRM
jgi:hypothetical protein